MEIKNRIHKLIILSAVFLFLAPGNSTASVRVRLGVKAGAWYPVMWTDTNGSSAQFKAKIGFSGGVNCAVIFGDHFSLVPELMFGYSKIGIEDIPRHFSSTVRSFTMQVPVLAVLRLGIVRIGAGPVFTVLDDPYYSVQGSRTLFGRLYPTVSYTAGVGLCFTEHFNLGIRYNGTFNRMDNYYAYDLVPGHETMVRTSFGQITLHIGFNF